MKYYSEEQVRKMFDPLAKFYNLENVIHRYLDSAFKDTPAIKIDVNEEIKPGSTIVAAFVDEDEEEDK